ncbi:arylesterase [Sphingomonas yabuuchiae]|nr:arylesterase [Sphingomonas yabuuchiae]MBB4608837.1 acyl-CoA thioesterase-1 [Sphingomonas yabuuchiae]
MKMPYVAGAALLQAAALLSACNSRSDEPLSATNTATPAPSTATSPSVPVSGPKRVVLAFGDSLYAGYGLQRGQSLPDAIQARLRGQGIDATVVNAGVSGDTSADGRRRLAYTLDRMKTKPDLVMLGLGGNDVLRQVDPAETRANMAAMLDELDRRGIPVILTGMMAPPNLGPDFVNRFNAIWPDLARQHKAALDPFILQGVLGQRQLMLGDGVHPNATGVSHIADRVAPLVAKQLAD